MIVKNKLEEPSLYLPVCVVNIVAIFTDQKAFGAKLGISRCMAVSIPLYQVVSDIADCVPPIVDIVCPPTENICCYTYYLQIFLL